MVNGEPGHLGQSVVGNVADLCRLEWDPAHPINMRVVRVPESLRNQNHVNYARVHVSKIAYMHVIFV